MDERVSRIKQRLECLSARWFLSTKVNSDSARFVLIEVSR